MADETPDVVLILTDDQRPDTLHAHARRAGAHPGQGHPVQPDGGCHADLLPVAGVLADRPLRRGGPGSTATRTRTGVGGPSSTTATRTGTLATALQARGYRTGLVGKYLNGFAQNELGRPAGHRPPGWDVFLTFANRTGAYYDYTLTDGSHYGTRRGGLLHRRAGRPGRPLHPQDAVPTSRCSCCSRRSPRTSPTGRPRRHLGDFADLPSYQPASVTETGRGQAAVPQGPPAGQAARHRLRPDPAAGAAGVRRRRGGGGG